MPENKEQTSTKRHQSMAGRTVGLVKGQAKSKIKRGILLSPYFWIVVGILVGVLALAVIVGVTICQIVNLPGVGLLAGPDLSAFCAETTNNPNGVPPPPKGVTINKVALPPADSGSIANGGTIDYRIIVTYDSSQADTPASQMILVDLPDYPFDPDITTSLPNATAVGNTYEWNLTDLGQTTSGTVTTYTARIILKPTVTDDYVVNYAYINISAASITPTPTPGSGPITPTCPGGNYFACLRGQFNVRLVGTSDQTIARFIFNTLAIPLSYPTYLRLFTSLNVTITVSPLAQSSIGAWATTDSSGDITLYQNLINARQSTRQQYLIHESAHSISWTTLGGNLQSTLYNQIIQKDPSCLKSGGSLIKTFPFNTAGNYSHEVWAEAVADSLVCNDTGSCGGWGGGSLIINNFPSTCNDIYNYLNKNLFDGML